MGEVGEFVSDKGSGRSGRAHRRSRHESSPPQRGDRTGDMAPQESPLGRLRAVSPRPSEWCPPVKSREVVYDVVV